MPAKVDRCVQRVKADLLKKGVGAKEAESRAWAICNKSVKGGDMGQNAFIVDLTGIKFDEGESQEHNTTWLNALVPMEAEHPFFGKIEITKERIKRFAQNVNDKVRGVDLAIDYGHDSGGRAAGWVVGAEDRDGQLWLNVDWTRAGRQALEDKEYRYFSAEFLDEWEDNGGNKFEDVLLGGGITNRPFVKDLVPINFSEYPGVYKEPEEIEDDSKEGNLDPKELAELLGLTDVDEGKILAEVKSLKTFHDEKASDDEKAKKFAEEYPEEAQQLAELREHNAKMAADATIKTLNEKGIAPKVNDKLREAIVEGNVNKFSEAISEAVSEGLVKLQEKGGGAGSGDPKDDVTTDSSSIDKAARELMANDDKLSYKDALIKVQRDNPELTESLRKELAPTKA